MGPTPPTTSIVRTFDGPRVRPDTLPGLVPRFSEGSLITLPVASPSTVPANAPGLPKVRVPISMTASPVPTLPASASVLPAVLSSVPLPATAPLTESSPPDAITRPDVVTAPVTVP